jgi:hypothetical protein
MQIPCVYLPGPAPAVSVGNNGCSELSKWYLSPPKPVRDIITSVGFEVTSPTSACVDSFTGPLCCCRLVPTESNVAHISLLLGRPLANNCRKSSYALGRRASDNSILSSHSLPRGGIQSGQKLEAEWGAGNSQFVKQNSRQQWEKPVVTSPITQRLVFLINK